MPPPPPASTRAGVAYTAAAYLLWGSFPVFFRLLAGVPAPEILSHRVLWSLAFLVALVTLRRGWRGVATELRRPGTVATLAASAIAISTNWLTYIWAVNAGHVLDASLGYFVNPLVSVVLGVVFLREGMTRPQLLAVLLAAAGVATLVVRAGQIPWIALVLAVTFGLYGLLRKRVAVDATTGLIAEVAILAPAAALYVAWLAASGAAHFGPPPRRALLLAASGPLTAIPLVWFAIGVRRLRLATVGLLQYLNPTIQFLVAVLAFGEPFTRAHALAFGLIWASLAVYSADALRVAFPR